MKSLLFLSLVGAAIYAGLLLLNPLPPPNSDAVAVQAESSRPADARLSSWASELDSLKPQIASEDKPPTPYYERKPRQTLRYVDESATPEAKSASAAAQKAEAEAAPSKVKARAKPVKTEAPQVVTRSDYKRPRWQRRADRRARKAFGRAFLLGN